MSKTLPSGWFPDWSSAFAHAHHFARDSGVRYWVYAHHGRWNFTSLG